jgi:hypothetical protein
VQGRSQRLVGKVLLPQPWCELSHARRRVNPYALQHIHEVGVRVNAVQPARYDQALHDASVLGANLSPTK